MKKRVEKPRLSKIEKVILKTYSIPNPTWPKSPPKTYRHTIKNAWPKSLDIYINGVKQKTISSKSLKKRGYLKIKFVPYAAK